LTVALLALQTGGITAFIALFLWPVVLIPFRLIEERLLEDVRINATHLADLDAARREGIEPLANALLKLGTRADRRLLLESQAQDLARAGQLDTDMLEAAIASSPTATALGGTRIDELANRAGREAAGTVSGEWGREAMRCGAKTGKLDHTVDAASEEAERHAAFTSTRTALRCVRRIDWRDFDTVLRDGKLDGEELSALLDRLRDEPGVPLFASGAFPEGVYSTPAIRDRLLFVDAQLRVMAQAVNQVDRQASDARTPTVSSG
jgi:hypothetical protein